jgi:hypothetical protein
MRFPRTYLPSIMGNANRPSMYYFNSTFESPVVRHVDSALEFADGLPYELHLSYPLPSYIPGREC